MPSHRLFALDYLPIKIAGSERAIAKCAAKVHNGSISMPSLILPQASTQFNWNSSFSGKPHISSHTARNYHNRAKNSQSMNTWLYVTAVLPTKATPITLEASSLISSPWSMKDILKDSASLMWQSTIYISGNTFTSVSAKMLAAISKKRSHSTKITKQLWLKQVWENLSSVSACGASITVFPLTSQVFATPSSLSHTYTP